MSSTRIKTTFGGRSVAPSPAPAWPIRRAEAIEARSDRGLDIAWGLLARGRSRAPERSRILAGRARMSMGSPPESSRERGISDDEPSARPGPPARRADAGDGADLPIPDDDDLGGQPVYPRRRGI